MKVLPLKACIPTFCIPSADIEAFQNDVLLAIMTAFPSLSLEEKAVFQEASRLTCRLKVKDLEEFSKEFLEVVSVCYHSRNCGGKSLTTRLLNLNRMLKEYRTERVARGSRRRTQIWCRTYTWESLRYHYVLVTSLQKQ